jgi:hypothetical protein
MKKASVRVGGWVGVCREREREREAKGACNKE